jgi:hypothetical protein
VGAAFALSGARPSGRGVVGGSSEAGDVDLQTDDRQGLRLYAETAHKPRSRLLLSLLRRMLMNNIPHCELKV